MKNAPIPFWVVIITNNPSSITPYNNQSTGVSLLPHLSYHEKLLIVQGGAPPGYVRGFITPIK